MGFVPELNFTIGIGKEGKPLFEIWAASKKSDGKFNYTITDKNLIGSSPNAGAGMSSLVIPSCGKDFGKKGISGFIDFQGLDVESFYLPGVYKSINVVKNITFKVDNKGSEMVINTTNPNQNILKQIIDLNTQDLKDMMGNMAI
jgi:frataxin-like iron-binding protein CyaY